MGWRVANSLLNLKAEVQRKRPDTVKRMYGTIGDAAHASRNSDHNPWVVDKSTGEGVVRALDIPIAVGEGHLRLANRLRKLAKGNRWTRRKPHPAFGGNGYIISNGRITSARSNWEWRKYTGSNPHREHIHVSVGRAKWRYDNDKRWNIRKQDVR